jgi:hypothetical protein
LPQSEVWFHLQTTQISRQPSVDAGGGLARRKDAWYYSQFVGSAQTST